MQKGELQPPSVRQWCWQLRCSIYACAAGRSSLLATKDEMFKAKEVALKAKEVALTAKEELLNLLLRETRRAIGERLRAIHQLSALGVMK